MPGENDRVVFDAAATVTMPTTAVTVRALEISGATVKLTGTNAVQGITASEYLEVLDGGIGCLDTRLTVNGDAYIRAGGSITHSVNPYESYGVDLGYGVYLNVLGDMLIEADGKIDANGCGYALKCGPYGRYGNGYDDYACHGSRGTATEKEAYGSIFDPRELGMGGQGNTGGGRVILTVGGTLTVNGTIDADGRKMDNRAGAGGSVNLICGTLAGSGVISARGADYTANCAPGCGGRVALRQTVANDLVAWTGTLAAWGGKYYSPTGLPLYHPGSVYLQMAEEAEKAGRILIDNHGGLSSNSAMLTGGVDLPVTNFCVDTVADYKNVTVELSGKGTLYVTGDVTIRELELESGTRVNLNGHVLTIRSREHKRGRGWPSNWATAIVYPGTDAAGNPGRIVWVPRPLAIILR